MIVLNDECYTLPNGATYHVPTALTFLETEFHGNPTFTKSNGTLMARVYERLTKASRRNARFYEGAEQVPFLTTVGESVRDEEAAYRRGVYDALNAIRTELSE